jgi:biotin carboxyl carrier protein
MKTVIRAEMVANVWRVVASVGDQVSADDPIVILESMKMEIPVASEDDCQVTQIFVTEGVVVQEGDPIAEIETSG